jgi:hypothetical protein
MNACSILHVATGDARAISAVRKRRRREARVAARVELYRRATNRRFLTTASPQDTCAGVEPENQRFPAYPGEAEVTGKVPGFDHPTAGC